MLSCRAWPKDFLKIFSVLLNGGSIGLHATIDYEPREVRKEAAVVIDSGAVVWLLELPPITILLMNNYLALARKWRPRTFSQLVGQEHINKVLINSLNQQRLHHAYLFTGTRGVGKTSIARIFTRALNCEQGISANPCLQCDICHAIEQGSFADLIEIDAASKTKVEDTREILENIPYAPIHGRFKVYLIDEVHMLSQHSFNALLKTLEEPPNHVKFLLATTDPQKLPVTILSRCLQLHLKHLAAELISEHLQYILKEEQVTFTPEALELLGRAAKGSMRDALSLLDQAIASCDRNLQLPAIKSLLGYTQENYALQLLQGLATNDAAQLITIARTIAIEGGYFGYVLDELLSHLHQIMLCQMIPENKALNLDANLKNLAIQLPAEDVQLFYQIGIKGSQDMLLAPSLAIGFEMTILRMLTFKPAGATALPQLSGDTINTTTLVTPLTTPIAVECNPEEGATLIPIAAPPVQVLAVKPILAEEWPHILGQLKLTGLALQAAQHASLSAKSGQKIILGITKNHQSLFTTAVISRIEQALTTYYQEPIKITFEYRAKEEKTALELSLDNDPFLQQLQQEFTAEVVKNSIMPIKDVL